MRACGFSRGVSPNGNRSEWREVFDRDLPAKIFDRVVETKEKVNLGSTNGPSDDAGTSFRPVS